MDLDHRLRLAGGDQPALDGEPGQRDHGVTAHGRVALILQEQHAQISVGQIGLDQQGPVHVGMTTRLGHQQAAKMVEPSLGEAALVEERGALERRIAARDDPHRLATGVHLDRGDPVPALHCARYSPLPVSATKPRAGL